MSHVDLISSIQLMLIAQQEEEYKKMKNRKKTNKFEYIFLNEINFIKLLND